MDAIEKQQAGLDLDSAEPRTTREQISAGFDKGREQISAGFDKGREQLNAGLERGREAAGNLWATVQERPWTSAAIAGGVVVTAAAATAGAVLLKRRLDAANSDGLHEAAPADISDDISAASRVAPAYEVAAE